MFERQRQGDSLSGNESRPLKLALPLQVSCLGEDLLQRTHLPGFVEEEADRLFQILQRPLLGATTGRYVEFPRVCHKGSAFLENLGGELDLHTLLGYLFDAREKTEQRLRLRDTLRWKRFRYPATLPVSCNRHVSARRAAMILRSSSTAAGSALPGRFTIGSRR